MIGERKGGAPAGGPAAREWPHHRPRRGLSPKMEAFAVAFVELSATDPRHATFEAYVRAYRPRSDAKHRTTARNAHKVRHHPLVEARIQELRDRAADKAVVSAAEVLAELKKIAFADTRKALAWSLAQAGGAGEAAAKDRAGAAVEWDRLDPDMATAIAEVSRARDGAIRVKFHDKVAVLTQLGRHLGLFAERPQRGAEAAAGHEQALDELE